MTGIIPERSTIDWNWTIIYDTEGMTRVNTRCTAGHAFTNFPVAKGLAHPNTILPEIHCGVPTDDGICNNKLIVVE